MQANVIKHGEGIAISIDKELAERLRISLETPIRADVVGEGLLITTVEASADEARFEKLLNDVNQQYGSMLQRLA